MIQLFDGDATFTKSFAKVGFTESGSKHTATFRAAKGRQFVVLLLGEVDAKATDCDLDAMLKELGYVREDREKPYLSASLESLAKQIYQSWESQPGFHPWIESGNSAKQEEARQIASRTFELALANQVGGES